MKPPSASMGCETSATGGPSPQDIFAFAATAVMAVVAFVWAAHVGLVIAGQNRATSPVALGLAAAAWMLHRRGGYFFLPIFIYGPLLLSASQSTLTLTYLGAHLGFPLGDEFLTRADALLGFHWGQWRAYLLPHKELRQALSLAYQSVTLQPPIAIVVLGLLRRPTGAGFVLASMIFVFTLTSLGSALVPCLGPAQALGLHAAHVPIVNALREPILQGPLAAVGIVAFPSLHTAVAVIGTVVYRDFKPGLVAAGLVNLFMLVAIPYAGDHYLTDMLGGAAAALTSLALADRLGFAGRRQPAEAEPYSLAAAARV